MPPRFAYWTILIDNAPTAFRAREADELQPTLAQLKRTNANVVLKWFARGRLWESQQEERDDFHRQKWRPSSPRNQTARPERPEKRSRDWRPGGDHKDPRARFADKKKREAKPWPRTTDRPEKPWSKTADRPAKPWPKGADRPAKPWTKPADRPAKSWSKTAGRPAKPWHGKPNQPGQGWRAKPGKPGSHASGSKPWRDDRRGPRKPTQPFASKWRRDRDPRRKRDTPEDE
jgi:hypothetical protein